MAMAPSSSSSSVTSPSQCSTSVTHAQPVTSVRSADLESNLCFVTSCAPSHVSIIQQPRDNQPPGIIFRMSFPLSTRALSSPAPHPQSSDELLTIANLGEGHYLHPFLTQPCTIGFVGDSLLKPSRHHTFHGHRCIRQESEPPVSSYVSHQKVNHIPTATSPAELESRDKDGDGSFIVCHDRRVRLSDDMSGSLYPLCRSWVVNGRSQVSQPLTDGGRKSYPRAFPARIKEDPIGEPNESDGENDGEFIASGKDLSVKNLLKSHVRRAKKIRTCLKEQWERRTFPYRLRVYSIIERLRQAEAEGQAPTVDVLGLFGHGGS